VQCLLPYTDTRTARGSMGKTASERHAAVTWAQSPARVFRIDKETCRRSDETVMVIASIEGPVVIKRILDHLDQRTRQQLLALGCCPRTTARRTAGPYSKPGLRHLPSSRTGALPNRVSAHRLSCPSSACIVCRQRKSPSLHFICPSTNSVFHCALCSDA